MKNRCRQYEWHQNHVGLFDKGKETIVNERTLSVRRERSEGGLSSRELNSSSDWFGLDVEDCSGSCLILLETVGGKV